MSHRRLLWAYPAAYRRRYGTEIITLLLEMAEDGRRPGRREKLDLVLCGLRQRFRVPWRRPLALLGAALAALALGAAGAVAGTWTGWQTATDLPSQQQIRGLSEDLSGMGGTSIEPWSTAMSGPAVSAGANGQNSYSPQRIRDALAAAGWHVTSLTESDSRFVTDFTTVPWTTIPARTVTFRAAKDGLVLAGSSNTQADGRAAQGFDIWAEHTAAVRPLTITGLVLGLLAGWLLAAALAARPRRGRTSAVLTVTAIAAASVPVVEAYRATWHVMIYKTSNPNPYVAYTTGDWIPAALNPELTVPVWVMPACALVSVLAVAAGLRVSR
ncbi:hypothetical protein [Actinoplanes sp. NPDC026623]|uniref:hypothetical protein n=1 Tax=Actinoplanes sp. NPDC026623 TaxID=3155610 RepID=UPI00340FFD97